MTNIQKAKSGVYLNGNGEKKAEARKLIVDAVQLTQFKEQRILSLPADNYTLEQLLFKYVDKYIKFDVCERNPKVLNRLSDRLRFLSKRQQPNCIYRCDIGNVINEAKENKYTHIVLDYCGQVGTFAEEIKTAIKNNVVQVNGTISMTFCKRTSGKANSLFIEKMLKLSRLNKQDKCETELAILTFLNRICGKRYVIETQFPYKDKDRSSMILYIIRRIK